jgi:hypothetical protein
LNETKDYSEKQDDRILEELKNLKIEEIGNYLTIKMNNLKTLN